MKNEILRIIPLKRIKSHIVNTADASTAPAFLFLYFNVYHLKKTITDAIVYDILA